MAGMPVGQEIPLVVADPSADSKTQSAAYEEDGVRFELTAGDNIADVDTTPMTAVVVQVNSMPAIDGQPLSVALTVYFTDGRGLQATYQAPVKTVRTTSHCAIETQPIERNLAEAIR
jgi:hypothetical protein